MIHRITTFPALLLLLYCILQTMVKNIISSSLPEIEKKNLSSFIDVVPKTSKIVKRALHEELKARVATHQAFIDEHLFTTNYYRTLHGVPKLELDYQLCIDAADYAETLAMKSKVANKFIITHSGKYLTGENILGTQNIALATGKFAAEHWYNESQQHDWANNVFNSKTGHFTQMIWKETTSMGVGRSDLPSTGLGVLNITVIVARYIPPGNWAYTKAFRENILPVTG